MDAVEPIPIVPFAVDDVTLVTVGATPSTLWVDCVATAV